SDPEVVADADADGQPSLLVQLTPMQSGIMFNSGAGPTADVTVRRAVAASLDLDVINERGYDGKGNVTSDYFPEPLPWAPGVDGPRFDLAAATRLVQEAEAGGWDRHVRLMAPPTGQDIAIAMEGMLE